MLCAGGNSRFYSAFLQLSQVCVCSHHHHSPASHFPLSSTTVRAAFFFVDFFFSLLFVVSLSAATLRRARSGKPGSAQVQCAALPGCLLYLRRRRRLNNSPPQKARADARKSSRPLWSAPLMSPSRAAPLTLVVQQVAPTGRPRIYLLLMFIRSTLYLHFHLRAEPIK